jgi:hypothetical protein
VKIAPALRSSSLAIVVFLFAPASRAQADNPVLVYCDDGDIGAADGSCASLVEALQNELTDFYLDVVHVDELVEWAGGEPQAPPAIVASTRQRGAIFAVWFTRSGAPPGNLLTMHVYDPAIEQTISRTVSAFDASGKMHHADVAFHTRIIMGASLYSDIDAIQEDENLVALAIPEERVTFFESRAPEPVSRVGLGVGYLFTGYPTERHWYHGIGLDVSVLPVKRLEIFLDLGFSFMQGEVKGTTGPLAYEVSSRKFLVGVGARYDVLGHDRVALMPEAGFHVGVTSMELGYSGDGLSGGRDMVRAYPSAWAGLALGVHVARRVSLVAGLRFEYVFRYERVHLVEGDGEDRRTTVFEASQFRFGTLAMVLVSI